MIFKKKKNGILKINSTINHLEINQISAVDNPEGVDMLLNASTIHRESKTKETNWVDWNNCCVAKIVAIF